MKLFSSYVQAKCPHCGGLLAVANEKDIWICELCKVPFNVQKAVKSFNERDIDDSTPEFAIRRGVLVKYRGKDTDVVIPETVCEIGEDAFKNRTDITSVLIPDTVRIIGDYSFFGCIRLAAVILPKNVKRIGISAFDGCTSLSFIEIPASVRDNNRVNIGENAFSGCTGLMTVSISDRIVSMNENTINNCNDDTVFEWANISANPAFSDVVFHRCKNGKCLHCGGDFKGYFRKICTKCGKNKDYRY